MSRHGVIGIFVSITALQGGRKPPPPAAKPRPPKGRPGRRK